LISDFARRVAVAGVDELFPRAVAAQREGDFVAAERDYRQILALDPHHAISLSNLGVILGRRGELTEAVIVAEAATTSDPNLAVAHFNLGNLYRRVGRTAEATKSYQRVLQLTPGFVPAHLNLGIAVSDLGDWPAAIEHFRRALELQPTIPDGLHHLGEALTQMGRIDEAIATLRASLNQSPGVPRSYLALARALFAAGQIDEVIHTLEHALQLQPQHAVVHNFLGIALDKAGRFDEAQSHFRDAVRIRPDFAGSWSNLGLNLTDQGRWSEAEEAFAKSLELRPDPVIASCRLAVLLGFSVTPMQLREEHDNWAVKYATGTSRIEATRAARNPGQRLKVGYVFGEFQTSVALVFLETLLTHHNREKVHITCYSNTSQFGVEMDRLRTLADEWRSLVGIDDSAAAELIRADQIDVLVDLNGHTVGNRLLVFARKPARVQVSLFGYPATTGLSAIDFRISDAIADPLGVADTHGPEKMLRLPDIGRLYVPPATAPLPSPLPAASRQQLTFGCLNDPGKLSEVCLETWAKILKSVSESRLVLQAGRSIETARHLTDRFARLGVESGRLILVYRMPEDDYFQAYQSIDMLLDTFPFNGRTTTCDALWMGVPVLSVAGEDCRSRQGASIMTNLGFLDFVADTPEKLVTLAMIWADQPDTLADLRAGLRDMMSQSPITDAIAYVRNLETAYSHAVNVSS
jgi:predicted O-linked N-acetylglucosamine transferase (SPINDLY family)